MSTTLSIRRTTRRPRTLRLPSSIRRTRAVVTRLLHRVQALPRSGARGAGGRYTPIERVMRRCSPLTALEGRAEVHVAVNVSQWMATGPVPRAADHRAAPVPAHVGRESAHRTVLRERLVIVQRALHERLFERLTAAAAPWTAVRDAAVLRVEHRSTYPRVPAMQVRAVVHSATRLGAAAVDAPPASTRRAVPVESPRPSPVAPPPLAAQELARVTDHVIRQLDRRVLSYMERTGRA